MEDVISLNSTMQLDLDTLNNDRLHGWKEEKKLVYQNSFAAGFEEWYSGFIANDLEYTFSMFDEDTQKWVSDFRIGAADSIKNKRIIFGLEEDDASHAPSPLNTQPPPTDNRISTTRKLSLLGNRIQGSIPQELANIATLQELFLEDNLLEGPIPRNFGSLIGLRRFVVSANKLNGTIPEIFGNLRNLEDFRIDGNDFSGKIPDFIGNWTNMTRLRISDLTGRNSTIPDLKDMQSLHVLILRNCLINGALPEYFGVLGQLKTLDVSYNNFSRTAEYNCQPSNV
ncbi:uncharacterized protein LOC141685687 [Apium graveolens]|uniref:uncharacterized protein LOC141685687 n=1 Tax=Apium graveolens TaxID=4045 RepID=UPI003D7A38D1